MWCTHSTPCLAWSSLLPHWNCQHLQACPGSFMLTITSGGQLPVSSPASALRKTWPLCAPTFPSQACLGLCALGLGSHPGMARTDTPGQPAPQLEFFAGSLQNRRTTIRGLWAFLPGPRLFLFSRLWDSGHAGIHTHLLPLDHYHRRMQVSSITSSPSTLNIYSFRRDTSLLFSLVTLRQNSSKSNLCWRSDLCTQRWGGISSQLPYH